MNEVIKWFISRLTMQNTYDCLFVDKVNGREVWVYVDIYGVKWMAQSKYGMRCKKK